ncbi:KdsC family phosphatase [Nitratifractor salsuginis]|uniref:3-deoxy-D-manno-octulosonate 8-phosphate phosphatase, YrbI family n=1 Tax=Nitratifractor salsuginis (strain DSM 16511 / JCM 12458 / E9I37-1) TaxID=749222 RepID=E6X356_NITSE|nr:HAD family hydrolase [Nitratifractor salsuginis]ADV46200.1 3-deoxy-D-manno-octulosonate 8-phosphate phosphatase, YrbI family [Nitratifractor salsuginis DSM 16511]
MAIRLIVLDVDGCLTDGRIVYSAEGDELKAFDVKDGLAIASWIRLGRQAAIITGRHSKIVERRAAELGISHYYQGVKNKKERLEKLLDSLGLKPEEVAAIGDDLNDWGMLEAAERSYAPADAVPMIRETVDRVLTHPGGRGAVREMIEDLLEYEGLWQEFLNLWSVA